MRNHGRKTVLGAGLVLAAVCLWLALPASQTGPGARPSNAPSSAERPDRRSTWSSAPAEAPKLAGGVYDEPIIESVTVEKQEVCAGEQNLVTVRATTAGSEGGAGLRVLVGGKPGQPFPLLAMPSDNDPRVSDERIVQVFGRDGQMAHARVPSFRIKDCQASHVVVVTAHKRPNTESEYQLDARIQPFGAREPFGAILYRWDFGDGRTTQTMAPQVVHDFADRAQDSLYSYAVVKVEAVDSRGRAVTGRHALELANKYYDNKTRAKTIVLRSSMSPRFAERDSRGVVRQTFRVWHHEPQPIRIERVIEQTNLRPSRPGEEAPPVRERELAPTAVLPVDSVPAAGTEFELTVDTTREGEVSFRSYTLEGRAADGTRVLTVLSLMVPPPDPTVENSIPIDNPAKKARVERALAMLGRSSVSDDEIGDLERKGAFKDLAPYSPLGEWKRTILPVKPRR